MSEKNFKQDDIVFYKNGHFEGRAVVKGCAEISSGTLYVLRDTSKKFPCDNYPFSHFTCFEQYLSKEDPRKK